jgi:hypothetical protein
MNRFLIHAGLCAALLAGGSAFAQDTTTTTTDPNAGAYDALSPGNQKIVNAIYESHIEATENMAADTTTTDGTTTEGGTTEVKPLTHDDIAAMKADGGWGKTYKQLYAEGKVSYKNLGQAISSYNRSMRVANAGTATVITTGNGQQISTGGKKDGEATSASAKGAGGGAGKKLGHMKSTVVTTGGGGTAMAGANSSSNAGGSAGFSGAGGAKGRGQGGASHKAK